jgi:hypothetical protein
VTDVPDQDKNEERISRFQRWPKGSRRDERKSERTPLDGGGEEAGSGQKVDVMDRNEGNCWLKRLGGGE